MWEIMAINNETTGNINFNKIMPPYKITEDVLAGRQEKRGTWSKPYLYKITPGQNNGKSLIFHLQIGENFYQVGINKVGKTFVYFDCKTLGI